VPIVNRISQICDMLRASLSAICSRLFLSPSGIRKARGAFFFMVERLYEEKSFLLTIKLLTLVFESHTMYVVVLETRRQ
jgi:hypothetical protein